MDVSAWPGGRGRSKDLREFQGSWKMAQDSEPPGVSSLDLSDTGRAGKVTVIHPFLQPSSVYVYRAPGCVSGTVLGPGEAAVNKPERSPSCGSQSSRERQTIIREPPKPREVQLDKGYSEGDILCQCDRRGHFPRAMKAEPGFQEDGRESQSAGGLVSDPASREWSAFEERKPGYVESREGAGRGVEVRPQGPVGGARQESPVRACILTATKSPERVVHVIRLDFPEDHSDSPICDAMTMPWPLGKHCVSPV